MSMGDQINQGSVSKAMHFTAMDGSSMVKSVVRKDGRVTVVLEAGESQWELWALANARIAFDQFKSPKEIVEQAGV